MTRQKAAVKETLLDSRQALAPAEILLLAKKVVPSLGLATVYRCLKELRLGGEIDAVEIPGSLQPKFEISSHRHHHHFVCRACQGVFAVNDCAKDIVKLIPRGFKLEQHELFLFGRCAMCIRNMNIAAKSQKNTHAGEKSR